jgi:hypothetical protein
MFRVFLVVLMVIASSTSTSSLFPYFPRSSNRIIDHLNSTSLAQQCRQQKIDVSVMMFRDRFYHIGEREPLLHAVALTPTTQYKSTRTVMIVCGMRARHFMSTDVCVRFVEKLCAGEVDGVHLTNFIVVPMVNRRVRDLMIDLWPEMRGESPRPWQDIYFSVPDMYRRIVSEIISGAQYRQVHQHYQCFDGSYHLTLLDQNYPAGWMQRLSDFESQLAYVPTPLEEATSERISGNGQVSLSDPETRILINHVSELKVDMLIELTQGPVAAVLAPFESPILSSAAAANSPEINSAIQKSLSHAESLAKNNCPSKPCVSGIGNIVSAGGSLPQRSGTIGDASIKLGLVEESLVVQIGHLTLEQQLELLADQRGAEQKVMNDCMSPYVPRFSDDADQLVEKWATMLGVATKKT